MLGLLGKQREILYEAYELHPQRFARGILRRSSPADENLINPPENLAVIRMIHLPRDIDFVTQVLQNH